MSVELEDLLDKLCASGCCCFLALRRRGRAKEAISEKTLVQYLNMIRYWITIVEDKSIDREREQNKDNTGHTPRGTEQGPEGDHNQTRTSHVPNSIRYNLLLLCKHRPPLHELDSVFDV